MLQFLFVSGIVSVIFLSAANPKFFFQISTTEVTIRDFVFENFEYNSIGIDLSLNNFVTNFKFIEEESELGNTNIIENMTEYNFNENNRLIFKTRRNREINITEYYNLVYEYKNDCLTAGIKFNKSYYEDRDLKPSENIFFSITLIPIGQHEQKISN